MLDSIWTGLAWTVMTFGLPDILFLAPPALYWAQWLVLLFLKCKTKYWAAAVWVTLSGWTMKSFWWHHGCRSFNERIWVQVQIKMYYRLWNWLTRPLMTPVQNQGSQAPGFNSQKKTVSFSGQSRLAESISATWTHTLTVMTHAPSVRRNTTKECLKSTEAY